MDTNIIENSLHVEEFRSPLFDRSSPIGVLACRLPILVGKTTPLFLAGRSKSIIKNDNKLQRWHSAVWSWRWSPL